MTEFDKVIPPGGVGKVTASVDTSHYRGPIAKSIRVTTNPASDPISLELKAEVVAHFTAVTRLPLRRRSEMVVEKKPLGFVVHGERVERLLERTNLDSEGGLERFQSDLDRLGVNEALEAAGVRPGDTVLIAGVEFEYQP